VNRQKRHFINNLLNFTGFIFGTFIANDVIYVFVVGQTPILVTYLFSLLIVLVTIVLNFRALTNRIMMIPKSFKAFIVISLFSILSVILFNDRFVNIWLNGIILLILNLLVMISTLLLYRNKIFVSRGILVGILINLIFSLYEYFSYSSGVIFNLKNMFPHINIYQAELYWTFRAQGLFSEPGHLMRFLAISFFLIYPDIQSKYLKYLFIVAAISISILTKSSTSLIFFVALLLYFSQEIVMGKRKNVFLLPLIGSFGTLMYILYLVDSKVQSTQILTLILNQFSRVDSNNIRISGMKNALYVFFKNPLIGYGWNMLPSVFNRYDFINENVQGSYSFLLSLFVELGIFASIFVYFLGKEVYHLVSCYNLKSGRTYLFGLLVLITLMTTTNLSFQPVTMITFGYLIGFRFLKKKSNKVEGFE